MRWNSRVSRRSTVFSLHPSRAAIWRLVAPLLTIVVSLTSSSPNVSLTGRVLGSPKVRRRVMWPSVVRVARPIPSDRAIREASACWPGAASPAPAV